MKLLSGHSRYVKAFGQVVSEPMAQLQPTSGTADLVTDSALSSDANLQQLAKTQLTWITRAPSTLSDARAVPSQTAPQTMAPPFPTTRGKRCRTRRHGRFPVFWGDSRAPNP
jgi:transposase